MRDAKKTASCFLIASGLADYVKDERKAMIQAALSNKINTVLSSSMGRLFDAVSSILNISQVNRYEGECAADLEKEAVLAVRRLTRNKGVVSGLDIAKYLPETVPGFNREDFSFDIIKKDGIILIDPKPVLEMLCSLRNKADRGILALAFHFAVADMIVSVCEMLRSEQKTNTVALCGGVFQNTILTERTLRLLKEKGFCVYTNEAVPPNDGSISLGQTYIGLMKK
jgi:hydrogenase maturation protein HypF